MLKGKGRALEVISSEQKGSSIIITFELPC